MAFGCIRRARSFFGSQIGWGNIKNAGVLSCMERSKWLLVVYLRTS